MGFDAAIYVLAALLGASLGGIITFSVSARSARRERRARYGESLLTSLTAAERRLASAAHADDAGEHLSEPILLREEAVAAWSFVELASTLETPAGRKAMRAWGEQLYDCLCRGAADDAQLGWLVHRLDLAVYLTIAWTAGYASGRDFALSGTEIAERFAPALRAHDLPDYGERPA
ncbi:hypothetical protein HII28_12745 [Planctomonas sp. JC2975]|uniref:hypothetical protein n=1 Tax=Planctomonas sp. JC2975 TaxID=2729626 RepID=UPI0014744833|nr:hypothetical protein [Planctomonas sp. JC2975]NNC12742.1 hypothetical protein [Planctomonas sp. JC2975]